MSALTTNKKKTFGSLRVSHLDRTRFDLGRTKASRQHIILDNQATYPFEIHRWSLGWRQWEQETVLTFNKWIMNIKFERGFLHSFWDPCWSRGQRLILYRAVHDWSSVSIKLLLPTTICNSSVIQFLIWLQFKIQLQCFEEWIQTQSYKYFCKGRT